MVVQRAVARRPAVALCGLLLFVAAVTGIGLMVSSLAVTQQQALLGAFLFMVPSIILSGFATPIANMPDFIQRLTLINPMRYFLVIVRGVFLEGATFRSLLPQFWPMALIAAITSVAAGWLFRRRVYWTMGAMAPPAAGRSKSSSR